MNDVQGITELRQSLRSLGRSLPGQVVLVLQGGGALGSYQAGVYQALHEAGIEPDWIIGTSIGAINASLIAGNAPQNRLSRLAGILEADGAESDLEFSRRLSRLQRKAVVLVDGDKRHSGLLQTQSAGPCRRRLSARRRQCRILFHRAARSRRSANSSISIWSIDCTPRPHGWRRACPNQPDALFRQPRLRTRRQAHHGVGRAAAGIPGRSHRRRALLGRRHSVEYPDRGGVRRQSAQELADLRRPSCGIRPAPSRPRWRKCSIGTRTCSIPAGSPATSRASNRRIVCAMSSTSSPPDCPRPSATATR